MVGYKGWQCSWVGRGAWVDIESDSRSPVRRYVFLDEAGNFDFSGRPGASRHFIVTSVTVDDCRVGTDLAELRREMMWRDIALGDHFHATEDRQQVRDIVFDVIGRHAMRIDATVIDKATVATHLARNAMRVYKTAIYQHLRHLLPELVEDGSAIMVVSAALGNRHEQAAHAEGIRDVIRQVLPLGGARHAMAPAIADPCLQVADYCCWAIQRKWERGDERSYALIAGRIASEFRLFTAGQAQGDASGG